MYPGAFEYFVSTGPDGLSGPQHVYCVSFCASDIWGADKSEPHTVIYADLFEALPEAGSLTSREDSSWPNYLTMMRIEKLPVQPKCARWRHC